MTYEAFGMPMFGLPLPPKDAYQAPASPDEAYRQVNEMINPNRMRTETDLQRRMMDAGVLPGPLSATEIVEQLRQRADDLSRAAADEIEKLTKAAA